MLSWHVRKRRLPIIPEKRIKLLNLRYALIPIRCWNKQDTTRALIGQKITIKTRETSTIFNQQAADTIDYQHFDRPSFVPYYTGKPKARWWSLLLKNLTDINYFKLPRVNFVFWPIFPAMSLVYRWCDYEKRYPKNQRIGRKKASVKILNFFPSKETEICLYNNIEWSGKK